MIKQVFLLGLLCCWGSAQTRVDVGTQSRGFAFLQPPFQQPVRVGATLPLECTSGELFFLTNAPAGGNLHVCFSPNQWAPQGSAGQGNLTLQNNGVLVGTRPVVNHLAGPGIQQTMIDDGATITISQSADTTALLTKASLQSGASTICISEGTVAGNYRCTLTPQLSTYTTGMIIQWIPDTDLATSTPTLEIDELGSRPIRLPDGVMNPELGEFRMGQAYQLWYDGAVFRVHSAPGESARQARKVQLGQATYCAPASGNSTSYSCSLDPAVDSYNPGFVVYLRPDVDNSASSVTLNINGVGPVPVRLPGGATALPAGYLLAGRLYGLWYDGAVFQLVEDAAGEGFVTVNALQSGAAVFCASANSTGAAYECMPSLALDTLQVGTMLFWRPDIDSLGGAITLDVSSLGPAPVKLADGTTDPGPSELRAGQLYPIWYDGTHFRLTEMQAWRSPSAQRPACLEANRGASWVALGSIGEADDWAVCLRDASGTYGWRSVQ